MNSTRKRILIFCNHEIVLFNFKKELLAELVQQNYEIIISMPFTNNKEYFEELGCICRPISIDRRGINPFTDLKLIWEYNKLIMKFKPDIIFTLTIKPTIYGGILSRIHKLKLVSNITGIGSTFQNKNLLKYTIVKMYKFALKKSAFCFFENKGNRDVFLENHIIQMGQSVVVNGAGVNLNEFEYNELIKNEKTTFTFVGRVMKEKGIDEFLFAVDKLSEYPMEFRVYGFCEDDYTEILEEYNQLDNFCYYGFTNNVKEVYHLSDCIVLPSYHEGMSNVILEASSSGRAVITSDIPGCREGIRDNHTGYLVKPKDKYDLVNKLKIYSNLTFGDKVQMSKKARLYMETKFNRQSVNQKYIEAFKALSKSTK